MIAAITDMIAVSFMFLLQALKNLPGYAVARLAPTSGHHNVAFLLMP
jgi:hypothetical protein